MRKDIEYRRKTLIEWLGENFAIEDESLNPNEMAYTFNDKSGDPIYFLDETGFYGVDWKKPISYEELMTENWTIIYRQR